jgi:hypothetical protein
MHLVRLLPGLLRALDMFAGGGKHRVYRSWCPSRASLGAAGGKVVAGRRHRRRGETAGGEVPEEDESRPPRAAPGSRNLPWDARSIPAKRTDPQAGALHAAGGWDGGLAFARGVGGDIRHGSGTSGTAKIPSACDWCVAGTRRSGNGSAGRHLKGFRSTRRRSERGGSEVPAGASCLLTAIPHWPRRLCRRTRGHAATPLFRACCATGRVVTSLRGSRAERRPRIAAMRAAGLSVGCGTASASTWPARRKRAG